VYIAKLLAGSHFEQPLLDDRQHTREIEPLATAFALLKPAIDALAHERRRCFSRA
jgi:hypothetical protein